MLVMSATPIPRSLALTLYGDLDISRITEMPKGRMRVDTFVVDESYRERLLNFIAKQIKLGGQCYVVCPSIESSDDEDTEELCSLTDVYNEDFSSKEKLKNALEFTEFLKQNLIDIRIACLHGKMKAAQKDEIMAAFSRGEIDLLVSTTVIEVGVNVPNASLMIIENAERFGMSQIHQLRGRVGRGARKSYCVLVEGSKSEKSAQRLEIMRTTYDGFEIAEKDLLLRGPGDFFAMANSDSAIRQSGGFDFKMASLGSDIELMNAAFSSAKALIKEDPELQNSENQPLYKEISSILSSDFSTIS